MFSSFMLFFTRREEVSSFSTSESHPLPQRWLRSLGVQPPGINPISQKSFVATGSVSYRYLIEMSILTFKDPIALSLMP